MKQNVLLTVVLICVVLIFSVCGGETEKKAQTGEPAVKSKDSAVEEGNAVAKEILETFDKAVAEVAALVKDKPEAAVLKPQLEALYKKYEEKMKEINTRYLALKTKDIRSFGAANGYLGENRGKHVFNKDKVLGEYISYYDFTKKEKEFARFLSKEIIKMLEVAVQR